MIPKKIYYCWFGYGKKTTEMMQYIEGWKSMHPDYEIIEWNENNFDIHSNIYVEEAYNAKKWAFVTDYVRLYVLYEHGGIYMDTDVEVLRPLNCFLACHAFSGFEARDCVPTGIMGAEKGMQVISDLLRYYDNRHFIKSNGELDLTTNVTSITDYFKKNGLFFNGKMQTIKGFIMYPQSYFCPNSIEMVFYKKPSKAYTIHHFAGSWLDKDKRYGIKANIEHYIGGKVKNLIGKSRYDKIRGK